MKEEHVEALMQVAVGQVRFAVTDALRHAVAHLGVEHDHPSKGVVYNELKDRIVTLLESDELWSPPAAPGDDTVPAAKAK